MNSNGRSNGNGTGARRRANSGGSGNHTKDGLSSVYLIDVEEGKKAYRYDLEIFAVESGRKDWSLTRGSTDLNRRISTELVKLAVQKIAKGAAYVYDGRSMIYFSTPLQQNTQQTFIERTEVSKLVQDNYYQSRFKVIFKACITGHVLDLTDLSQYETAARNAMGQEDHSLRTFLELATAQQALERDTFIKIGNGHLYRRKPHSEFVKNGCISFHEGLCKGVKVVNVCHGKNSPAVVLDARVSAFMKSQTVASAIQEFLKFNRNEPEKLAKFFQGVKVQCTYGKKSIFTIGGFGTEPLKEESFQRSPTSNERVYVVDYLKGAYKGLAFNQLYSNLPGVYPAGNGRDRERFPAEHLLIIEGQKIPQHKQTPGLVDILLQRNTVEPKQRNEKIEQSGEELGLWDEQNAVLRAFGIKVKHESNDTQIDIRPLPNILYGKHKTVAPGNEKADWVRNTGEFLVPAVVKNWVVICYDTDSDIVEKFVGKLKEKARAKGMRIDTEPVFMKRAQDLFDSKTSAPLKDEWINCFKHCGAKGYEFAMLIDSKKNDSHGLLKLFEVFGRAKSKKLITQQVTIEVVRKVVDDNKWETLENIVNKLNVKFGGLNYAPFMKQQQSTESALAQFEQRFNLNNGDILVIGYDVSHPTQKIHEQKKMVKAKGSEADEGEKMEVDEPEDAEKITSTEPSVVGICANMAENPHNFVGDYFYQTARKESVDLEQLEQRSKWILSSLEANRQRNKRPSTVFILRDGLSEGQYQMAYRDELDAIKRGFQQHDPKYSPKFVLVIGTKRHFKKFYSNQNNHIENMPPGSIIQDKVVRPDLLEFYMQSHHPIRGTGKTVEYAILCNEVQFNCSLPELQEYAKLLKLSKPITPEALKELMFKRSLYTLLLTLCFSHQIVSKPVSLPEPVYQADELAKRGHSNYMTLKQYYSDQVQYVAGNQRLVDNAALTAKLSYWGNGQLFVKNRFSA